ncbi:MAG: DsrE/DsrF/DrsH-like family protein [Thermoproteus sp. AZ2]|jgi:predicted peroxiredoxin|uniref:DsrE/DsrF/DrsH-like family protein n=1 Tax=Thermoproteus sp. AZ2 TaxID=1609232 RepID=A0ACC6UZT0_9CREN|nr:MAG: peroxiredoxin [Thermoproteus sp. AZ2]
MRLVILLSDNDIARAYHAFVVALSAKAIGYEVHVFVSGIGVLVLQKRPKTRLIGLPWIARWYIARQLRKMGVKPLEELVQEALKAGVKIYVDEPAAKMLGGELIPGVEVAGSLSFLALAKDADLVLTL